MTATTLEISGISELEVFDLRSALAAQGIDASVLEITKPKKLPGTGYGTPDVVSALVSVAPQIALGLSAALAVWVAKSKSGKQTKAFKFKISRNGAEFASFSSDEYKEGDASGSLKEALKSFFSS